MKQKYFNRAAYTSLLKIESKQYFLTLFTIISCLIGTTSFAQTITSFSPTSACAGSDAEITINGTGFDSTTTVAFNGENASIRINTPTELRVILPASATTGRITVANSASPTPSYYDFVVNPVIVNNTVSAVQTICSGYSPAALTGTTPTGGNTTYAYLWENSTNNSTFVAATGTNSDINYTPGALTQTTWYRRTVTSGPCTDVSAVIEITVNPVIVNNTVSAVQTICSGYSPAALTGTTPTGGNTTYAYLWESSTNNSTFVAATGTNSDINYTPGALTQTTWYRRTVTSGPCTDVSAVIEITVNPVIVNNTVSAVQTICSGYSPAALTGTTPTGGNTTYAYLWESSTNNSTFVAATGTNSDINYTPGALTQTTWYRRTVTSGPCTDVSAVTVQVTVADNQAPVISCPAPATANTDRDGAGNCTTTVSLGTPTATDNCTTAGNFTFIAKVRDAITENDITINPLTYLFKTGTTIVTWTATDQAGNVSASCNQNVTVTDKEIPTITCPLPATAKTNDDGAGNCTTTVSLGTPTATDNCTTTGNLIFTAKVGGIIINPSTYLFSIGNSTVIWTATDQNGNISLPCNQIVTVTDNEKPTITAPANVNTTTNTACTATAVVLGTPVTADNCSVANVTNDHPSTTYPLGSTTVIWKVTDGSGNTQTASQIVTVTDNVKPTISCSGNLIPYVSAGSCTASVATSSPTTADNCTVTKLTWTLTGATTGASAATGINNLGTQIFNLGITTVNYRVEDAASNFATCSYTVTVIDNIAPTISCPGNLTPNVGIGTCTASVATSSPTTADNCTVTKLTWTLTGATTGASAATGINNLGTQIFNLGITTVNYRVEDAAGNFATCSYTVTVIDNIAPTISCPGNLTPNVGIGTCTASVATSSPTTADNCTVTKLTWTLTGATTGASAASGINNLGTKVFNLGITTVNYRVEDAAGNFATCSYTVTVIDNIAPTISCPGNLTPNVGIGTCTASVATSSPTTADNCTVTKLTWTLTGVTTGASAATGINNLGTKVFNLGITTVNYRVEDAAGNFATCSYTVTVIDNIAPTISCPGNLTPNVGIGTCTATVATSSPTTADNCTVTKLTWTLSGATTGASAATGINNLGTKVFNLGITTVNYRVEDAAGNFATCSYTVTVIDNIAPTISCPGNLTPNVGIGTCTASVATSSPATADNCTVTKLTWTLTGATTGASALTGINNLGTKVFNLGITTVNYRVEDAAGNFATCSYTVTVIDNITPTISAPTNISATTNTACTATGVVLGTPTTGDNCSVASVTNDAPTAFPIGNTTVTWTATDGSGNTKTATQLVTVTDNILPIARCKNISIVLDNTGNASITVDQINNNSSDNCGISSVIASKLLFNCGNLGNNSVTLTVTDNSGNKASCIATVTITNPAANATISISASPNTAICVGTNITFTASPTNAGINPHYQWYKNGTPVGTDSATYSNTTLSNGETIYVELRSGPCSTYVTSNTFTAVVNDLPIVSAPSKICMGSTGTLSPTTGGTWVSNNTSIATVTNGGVITAVAPGTTTFRYTKTSTTCSSTTIPVTIYALPIVSSPTQVCVNETKVLSPTTGGTWTSSNTSVATVNNAGVISGVAVGNATFTFTDGISGCSRTTTSVSVKAIPVILSASATPSTVCSGEQSTLDAVVQGATSTSTTLVNYNFNSGNNYGALVSNAVAGITSSVTSLTIPFDLNNGGVVTTGTAFVPNTAGNYLNADAPGKSWIFSLGGTDLPNYTSFKIYFQAQRQNTRNIKTVTVSYTKNGGTTSVDIGSVSLNSDNTWYVGTFTLPPGVANSNTLEITLSITGSGNNDVGIDNFQVQGTKLGATYLYSWAASPDATAGLPANAAVPSVSNKTIPVYPTVTTNYIVTATNTDGCTNSKNITITVYPDPKLKITADYCFGPNQVKLYASSLSPIGNLVWSTGQTGASITVDTSQYVEVVGTTPDGCSYVASLQVAQELVTDGDFTNFNPASPSFFTEYNQHQAYYTGTVTSGLYPEGDYAVNANAYSPSNGVGYHPSFQGKDHTNNSTGDRNFLMVNGSTTTIPAPPGPNRQRIIWQQTVTVKQNTEYYFSAYAMNLNPTSPARLQFEVNGVLVGSIADLNTAPKPINESQVNLTNWVRFYSTPTWNSGTATTAIIRIRNLNTVAGGNDFGLDDISFGTLSPFLTLTSGNNTDAQTICQDNPITDITYSVGSGVSAPNVTELPAGVTSSFNGITLRIIGTPTAAPGTYPYTISTTGSCGKLTATGTITINPAAIVNAGTDIALCSTTTNVPMAATLGGSATSGMWTGGTGSFSNNTPTALYTLGAGDTGTVTLTYTTNDPDSAGPCLVVSDTVDLIITPNFAANAGTVTTTSNCADTIVTLAANGAIGQWAVTSGQAAGSYSFSNTSSPTSTFTGESGETYTLSWTITNLSPCPPSVDTVTFTIANCLNIYFDGVDDNIDFGNNFNLTNTFSFEIWAKPNALNGFTKTILSKKDITDVSTGYDLRLENNSISFYSNNSKVLTHNGINSDRWYHIAVTFDGATYKLYFDGIEMDSKNGAVPITNNYKFLIGAMNKSGNKTINYFNGSLDELRIWNISLTNEQIRQMMNQEIIKNGNNVDGAVIPLPISGLTWTNLAGYYRMNQGTSDVLGGKLNGTGFVSGRLLKMTQPQEQTAPLPYTTRADDQDWSTDETWTNYPVWNYPNSLGVNGDPIDWNIVKLSHNVKSGNKDITLLGLIIDSDKKLTIADPNQALDEKNNGHGLWITHYLKLNGAIDLVGESQLVEKRYTLTQSSESILDESSSGYIKRDQQGKKSSFNYNYWSSPVTKQKRANNAAYSIAEVLRDGTASATPKAINFGDGAYFADGPVTVPIKISKRWLYSYNSPTPGSNTALQNYYLWNYIGNSVSLQVGEGFTMKGTGGPASILATQNYTFIGKPNSGTITRYIPIGQTYLLGNPYPSALDADEFIKDNLEGRAGHNVINGVLLFWDHFGTSNNHNLAQYEGGYSTYTLMGGVAGINNSPLTSNNLAQGLKAPERYIAVGQGFFVTASLDPGIKGTTATVDGGDISFKNSQRTFEREAAASSLFVKQKATDKSSIAKKDTRLKIRLGFDSAAGLHRQLLLGADDNSTSKFDIGYDAIMFGSKPDDVYWDLNDLKLVIQAVPNFNDNQIIPMGISVAKEGQSTIKIDALENISNNLDIYLYDNVTEIYHDIKSKPLQLLLPIGQYKNRFSLQFVNKPYDIDKNNLADGIVVYYTNNNEMLNIKNRFTDVTVDKVSLFNILGQKLTNWDIEDIKQNNIQIPIKNVSSGVYIVKLATSKGDFSEKIIIQ